MTIRKLALGISTALILTAPTPAHANPINLAQEFCGSRYCGQQSADRRTSPKKHRRVIKKRTHKEKRVRLASLHPATVSFTSDNLVARASAYLGMNARQVGVRLTLWCSAFIRKLTGATGVDDRAISWLAKPRTRPRIGAIAVMRHHVGIVKGFDRRGNPILISGNHGRKVGIGTYSKHRILAYVTP